MFLSLIHISPSPYDGNFKVTCKFNAILLKNKNSIRREPRTEQSLLWNSYMAYFPGPIFTNQGRLRIKQLGA